MKILLVSDDLLFARLAANKLEKWGHRVMVETSGTAALERIHKEPFRVVITGWELTGISGAELCREIRALDCSRYTYIIVYTSASDKESIMAGYEAGADDYLLRPFNALELRYHLRAGKRLLNLEDELREQSGSDSLTGLVNEISFRQLFRVILAETRRTESGGALMFLRITNYTDTLERLGLVPAQKMMIEVSKALNRTIRDSDLIAHMADDEFCLALQNTFWERCIRVAEKITAQIENMSLFIDDVALRPQIAISIVNYPVGEMGPDELIDAAERMPYESGMEKSHSVAGNG
ncbi:MAG: response regulator [Alphaproteobacteria bacterium]